MLLLPSLVWLLVPSPHHFLLPPSAAATAGALEPEPGAAPASPRTARVDQPARSRTSAAPAPVAVGPVNGVVLDPEGHPAKGATVAVTCEDRPIAAIADDQGAFQLGPEAAGCTAVARSPDHVASDPVTLAAGRSNTLHLNRGGILEGEVLDEQGAPVESYLLGVESYQGPTTENAPGGATRSIQDPRGLFAWENLVPGRYVLVASAEGRPPARSRAVDVEVGRTTSHVRITLARGATLSGHVVDAATHQPLAGAWVDLDAFTATRAQAIHAVRTDDQGAYSLEGAPAGPFSIRVTHDGYRARVVPGLTTRGASTLQQDVELNKLVDGGPSGEDYAGIGAYLAGSPKGVTIARFVPGGPAEKSGLQVGDLIRRVDGADASILSVNECMQILRGPDGSRVSLQVEREGRSVDVTLQRKALSL
jgi:protocatechuate 3,4-dioxygenase beta subunit